MLGCDAVVLRGDLVPSEVHCYNCQRWRGRCGIYLLSTEGMPRVIFSSTTAVASSCVGGAALAVAGMAVDIDLEQLKRFRDIYQVPHVLIPYGTPPPPFLRRVSW